MATTRPTNTTPFQERIYAMLEPVADQDPENGWALLEYCGAIAAMYNQIWTYVKDGQQGEPGWSILLDTNRIPVEAVPWLAEVTGTILRSSRQKVEVARNIFPNPGAETSLNGVAGSNATLARVGAPVKHGSWSYRLTAVGPGNMSLRHFGNRFVAIDGLPYSAAAEFQSASTLRDCRVYLDFYNSSGVRISVPNGPVVTEEFGQTVRAKIENAIAPVGTVTAQAITECANVVTNEVHFIDDVIVTQSEFIGDYFDGSFPNAVWLGTPGESVSVLYRDETNEEYLDRLRSQVQNAAGLKRGTVGAMREAIRQRLEGNDPNILIKERDGSAYRATVITYTSETPSQAAVLDAIKSQKPAGIIVDYFVVPGNNYVVIRASYIDYTAVRSAFLTYDGLRNNQPGT